jgi:hypothetical protein
MSKNYFKIEIILLYSSLQYPIPCRVDFDASAAIELTPHLSFIAAPCRTGKSTILPQWAPVVEIVTMCDDGKGGKMLF